MVHMLATRQFVGITLREGADVTNSEDGWVRSLHEAINHQTSRALLEVSKELQVGSSTDSDNGDLARQGFSVQLDARKRALVVLQDLLHGLALLELDPSCSQLLLQPARQVSRKEPRHDSVLWENHGRGHSPAIERCCALEANVAATDNNGLFLFALGFFEKFDERCSLGFLSQIEDARDAVVLDAHVPKLHRRHTSRNDELVVRDSRSCNCYLLGRNIHCCGFALDNRDAILLVKFFGLPLATAADACVEARQAGPNFRAGRMQVGLRQSRSLIRQHWLSTDHGYLSRGYFLGNEFSACVASSSSTTKDNIFK
mmetsp:Transcript_66109/g.138084  ORF Transcript_66109/g.138084 Transcript_66109/m.138084 type:complete len:314 (+) Transcript_66109:426-1367(+)